MKYFEHNHNQEQYIDHYRNYNIDYVSAHLLSDAALVSCGLKSRFCFTQSLVYTFPPFVIGVNALPIVSFVQNINSYKPYLHCVINCKYAVMANQTDGNGYGVLSPIAQNAIRIMRDRQLRPDAYTQAEKELKVLLADLIADVQNGKDYMEAVKEAYIRIYQSINPSFNYDEQFSLDTCYRDIPAVGNEKFTVARKLLLESKK